VLKERAVRSHITLEKNPFYWNPDCAKSSCITFSIIEDPHTAYTLFQKGELDWYGDPCGIIPLEIISQTKELLNKKQAGGLYWLVTCCEKPHLASAAIRRAIATAINRRELVDFIQGGEEPAFSVLPKSLSMLTEQPFQDGNAEQARAFFLQGCRELGISPASYPKLTITHWAESTSKGLAEILQQQIQRALGITVELEGLDWGTYMKRVPAGEIDIATAPWTTWVEDPMFNLNYLRFRKNGINGTCWQNPQYITQLNEADASIDAHERTEHMKKAEQIATQELPLIPVYYLMYKYLKQPNVHGEVISPVGAIELKWLEKDKS
jgi:oligopeptide transport system substrate-binding protein